MLKVLIIDLFIRDPYHFCLGEGNIHNYPEKPCPAGNISKTIFQSHMLCMSVKAQFYHHLV